MVTVSPGGASTVIDEPSRLSASATPSWMEVSVATNELIPAVASSASVPVLSDKNAISNSISLALPATVTVSPAGTLKWNWASSTMASASVTVSTIEASPAVSE